MADKNENHDQETAPAPQDERQQRDQEQSFVNAPLLERWLRRADDQQERARELEGE